MDNFKLKSRDLFCFVPWLCIVKNGQKDHFPEGTKVRMSNAPPIKPFSVESYDLKSLSFKFDNDIFITFEMPQFGKSLFIAIPSICNQRSLNRVKLKIVPF